MSAARKPPGPPDEEGPSQDDSNNPCANWRRIEIARENVIKQAAAVWCARLNYAGVMYLNELNLLIEPAHTEAVVEQTWAQFLVWAEAAGYTILSKKPVTGDKGEKMFVICFTRPARQEVSTVVQLFPGRVVH